MTTPLDQAQELETLDAEASIAESSRRETASALAPADGGWQAWLFLFASFLVEMLLWGFPFSFGVLQEYYSTHEPISSHPSGISAVGTTCSGILYLGAPLLFALCQFFPRQCRQFPSYGLAIVAGATALSSLATEVWHLILTQGVMYACGGMLMYFPIYIFIDEWFVRRKGFAFGIMWAGSGCGGLVGPLVLNWGLSKYGVATFLRGWAVAMLVAIGPLLYFIRPRLPPPRTSTVSRTAFFAGFNFITSRIFLVLQLGNIIQGLGYFIPALYLPSFARAINLSSQSASLVVSLLNTATVPGVIALSAFSDRTNVTNVVAISTLGSAVAVFLLWGLCPANLPMLIVFAITWGFFAGGYTATYAGTLRELRRVDVGYDFGSMLGVISVGRGFGNVVCGPISELILGGSGGAEQHAKFAYGTSYGGLIVFTGVTASLAMVPWVGRRLHLI